MSRDTGCSMAGYSGPAYYVAKDGEYVKDEDGYYLNGRYVSYEGRDGLGLPPVETKEGIDLRDPFNPDDCPDPCCNDASAKSAANEAAGTVQRYQRSEKLMPPKRGAAHGPNGHCYIANVEVPDECLHVYKETLEAHLALMAPRRDFSLERILKDYYCVRIWEAQ